MKLDKQFESAFKYTNNGIHVYDLLLVIEILENDGFRCDGPVEDYAIDWIQNNLASETVCIL